MIPPQRKTVCFECPHRKVGPDADCHIDCEKYNAEQAKRKAAKKDAIKFYEVEDFVITGVRRGQKKRKNDRFRKKG